MIGLKVIAVSFGIGSAAAATVSLPAMEPAQPAPKRIERIASETTGCGQQVWPNIAAHCIRNGNAMPRTIRSIALIN